MLENPLHADNRKLVELGFLTDQLAVEVPWYTREAGLTILNFTARNYLR